MLTALACLTLGAAPPESPYLPRNLYLVRATIVEMGWKEYDLSPEPGRPARGQRKLRHPLARLRISHVYLGPAQLTGKHFTHEQQPMPASGPETGFNDRHILTTLKKGLEGLWWVRGPGPGGIALARADNRDQPSPWQDGYQAEVRGGVVDASRIRAFPYLKSQDDTPFPGRDVDAHYREGLAWAKAVEKVARAGSDRERVGLLRGYATEHSPRGAWAIAWLAASGEKESVAFVRKLADEKELPLNSQLAIDRGLLSLDPYVEGLKWKHSKQRAALHERWRELFRKQGRTFLTAEAERLMSAR